MADNVQINAMTGGPTIAADDIGAGVMVQRVKVGYGPDGALIDVHEGMPLPTTLVSGALVGSARVTVPDAGTPVALPAGLQVYGVTVRALLDNTGVIYVGGPAMTAASGFELAAGDAVSLDVTDPSAIYIDAAISGDGVCLVWVSA
jgi:hypothetical protein